ncbi:MAG: nucleotide disphospho-sugar-binding domain-containing protein, partial [Chloroflexota bacterium]
LVPIVVIGNNPMPKEDKAELIDHLPKGSRLLNWVNFAAVLPRCKIAFHHGGMGTTHAILTHGVPQIVVPHAADQRGQAKRVEAAELGFNLSAMDVRNSKLLDGARKLTTDEKYTENARAFAAEMAAAGGPLRAAEHLLAMLQRT